MTLFSGGDEKGNRDHAYPHAINNNNNKKNTHTIVFTTNNNY